jgi:hypothetical protein
VAPYGRSITPGIVLVQKIENTQVQLHFSRIASFKSVDAASFLSVQMCDASASTPSDKDFLSVVMVASELLSMTPVRHTCDNRAPLR